LSKKNQVASPAPHPFLSPLVFLSTILALSFFSVFQEEIDLCSLFLKNREKK